MNESAEKVRARAETYQILSECYYPPEESSLQMLQDRRGPDDTGVVASLMSDGPPEVLSLQREYASLFLGPFKALAPPYGSVYMEGGNRTYGESTMDAKRRYQEDGLKVTLKEPPDHVAIELEYLYLLAFREAELLAEDKPADADCYRVKQGDFLTTHLGAWVSAFTDKIIESAETEFYRRVAEVTATHVQR